eukprot:m.309466 g.309466  ORF g.309466 m.309466 type:complete len:72 (+) comp46578_c0_seq1:280-495(+)
MFRQTTFLPGTHLIFGTLEVLNAECINGDFIDSQVEAPFQGLHEPAFQSPTRGRQPPATFSFFGHIFDCRP